MKFSHVIFNIRLGLAWSDIRNMSAFCRAYRCARLATLCDLDTSVPSPTRPCVNSYHFSGAVFVLLATYNVLF